MNPVATRTNAPLRPRMPDGAAVKLIGLGGVGAIVARYGALFLASLDVEVRLVLIDGDAFEPGNSTRMLFGACGNKAAVTRDELAPRFADSRLSLLAVEEYAAPENVGRLIGEDDVVLLTVDNHATRKLVNDRCAELDTVCLISGGNDGVGPDPGGAVRGGTYGNVQIYWRRKGKEIAPPLTWRHPEIAQPVDRLPTDQGCAELAAAVPQILFANLAVASAILNALFLRLSGTLAYSEVAFDIAAARMRPVAEIGRSEIGAAQA